MAKKITISFSDQPITIGPGFNYSIEVGSFAIYFSNGSTECKIEFIPNASTPVNDYDLPIGLTLAETIQLTLNFLNDNYQNDLVIYSLVGDTIEVLIQADATVIVDGLINSNISVTSADVEPTTINLIYYHYFDDYVLNIYKNNYQGLSSEIFGSFSIKKSTVDEILTPVRGTGLQLYLEANSNLTFDEFLLNDEFTYKTELIKSGQTIFEGYIKPDGIQQSYVNDQWLINVETTDALGALKDLSFVQANGLRFTGKMSVYDVIKGCLDRTKLSLTINTSVNIEYIGYAGTNILKDIYVSTDRFIKDKDDSVLMDCNEVLTSMLNMFSAVITQQDGNWWIYRPNDLKSNGAATFINQDTDTTFLYNFNQSLGSQINGFYPHHCDANQQIEVKGAISAYRVNYEYGFIDGFIKNPNLNHDADLVFEDWTTNPSLDPEVEIINEHIDSSGLEMSTTNDFSGVPTLEVMTSSPIVALANSVLTFRAKVSSLNYLTFFGFQIKTSDGYYLEGRNGNNQWTLNSASYIPVKCGTFSRSEFFATFEFVMTPIPNDCDITITILVPVIFIPSSTVPGAGIAKVSYAQILDNELQKGGIIGEFHTVTRFKPPSSITKENQKVFNGDGAEILIGSIYKNDLITRTDFWSRKNKLESLPLLGISAMDDLRIQSNPIKVFSGSIFGYIPYMSVVTIDNIIGLFMFIEYEYDVKSNKVSGKLQQFYNTELSDIQYSISPDYGKSTIKPTIKG